MKSKTLKLILIVAFMISGGNTEALICYETVVSIIPISVLQEQPLSGRSQSYTVVKQGKEYFSYDTRTITLLNGTSEYYIMLQTQSNPTRTTVWLADNDGCADTLEGSGMFNYDDLGDASGTVLGIGSMANN